MRILVVGGTGVLGKAVVSELAPRHDIIVASREKGEICIDVENANTITTLFQKLGRVDAVISTLGKVHFAPLAEFTAEQFVIGLNNKLMGQVNLVLIGKDYLNDGGSFTLTSGILNRDPIRYGASAAMVNGALDAFVKAAALEMPRGFRINAVSPTVLTESMNEYASFFPGFTPVPASIAARAYAKSVEGAQTGQVYYVN